LLKNKKHNDMERKEEIQLEIAKLKDQIKPLEKELNDIHNYEQSNVEEKIIRCYQLKDNFTEDELVFAATARCNCGAGLAYPKGVGMHGSWLCSDILLGVAIPNGQEGCAVHDSGYHFSFYNIKSDQQPSAEGRTTRRKKEDHV